ncbi:hypothetical protein L596_027604 [Steinernema carpocapsae]|uniref:PAS domain-containing protein n=1 Tax=Steinernema carpocapsae TaxID=34508 RepID=A0A4U5LW03_STECR|nr:hypothetical protein L596_027604 [Steinernema carpocapsae]
MENVMQDSRKRNLDKRRETSRYAARDRRGKEADIFVDLRDVVPIVDQTTVTHVDRIALLRVAATLCRMRSHIGKSLQAPLQPKADEVNLFTEDTITECLDGFIMIIDMDGQVLYVTESVTFYLGITQTDMVGRFLRDFTNQKDYESYMRDIQEGKSEEGFSARVLRMKSVISPRGRTLNLKSAVDKPVWVCYRTAGTGNSHHVYMQCATNPAGTSVNMLNTNGIAMKNGECTTGTGMTRHTCDMKITYVSENMGKLVQANNYRSNNLVGVSFYDLVHPADAMRVSQWISEVFVKTSCRTSFYRILGAAKNVIWVQTEAVIMNHTLRGKKGQYIICTHHFLGIQTDASSAESVKLGLTCGTLPVVIKQEVDDYPDFVGIEPRVVDCLDFTPLVPNESRVPPRMQINIDEFTPMRADGNFARPASPTQFQQQGQNLRKSSYDDVLQWLFRDHPDSPAPFSSRYDENLQSSQDDQDGNEFDTMRQQREQPFIGEDPPLTVSTFYDPSRKQSLELPRGCGNDQAASFLRYQRQNHANSASPASAMGERLRGSHGSSPLSSNGSARGPTEGASPMEWSPLAAGIADCNLRSPVENCINRSLAANPSAAGVPFMPRMRAGNTAVPTISQADGYNLVPGTNAFRAVGAGSLPRAAVYANVPAARAEAPIVRSSGCSAAAETSAACSGVRRSFGQFEPQQFVTVTASGPQQPRKPSSHNNPNNTINFPQQTTDGSMHKSPMDYSQLYVDCQDNLQSLAPFVADEEMFQLTNTLPADLQGLFSDDPSDEWMNSFGPINAGIDGSGCGNVMGMRNNNFMSDRLY